MEVGRQFLALVVFLNSYQCLMGAYIVKGFPETAVVNPGEDVTFRCRAFKDGVESRDKLDLCTFSVSGQSYYLSSGSMSGNIKYVGAGLDQGDCGIQISQVDENLNGNISCSLKYGHSIKGINGQMTLIVTIPPKRPKLELIVGSHGKKVYKEKDTLSATCVVRDGRPVANITWYLGSEQITGGLNVPQETCLLEKKEICTIQQNLTRVLQASDDKKDLKCVASHYSFKGVNQSDQYTIYVHYPPKPETHPFEFFDMVEGGLGSISVKIEANPQPFITWMIDDQTISEGKQQERYTVNSTIMKAPGVYETALLINPLTKEDTDKKYWINARNDYGETQYLVQISTSPGPKALEMADGLIITIVVILLLLVTLVSGMWYLRKKGMFCFAARDGGKRVNSPSEGTENPAANHNSNECIDELKKEKPKEDTPV